MRQRQGGSVQSFVVVGLVLFVLCGGLLYAVGHRNTGGEVAKNTPEIEVDFPDVQVEQGKNTTGDTQNSGSTSTTTKDKKDTATSTDSTSADSDVRSRTDSTTRVESEVNGADVTSRLPETGPADTLASIISSGILAAAGYAYIDARRASRANR